MSNINNLNPMAMTSTQLLMQFGVQDMMNIEIDPNVLATFTEAIFNRFGSNLGLSESDIVLYNIPLGFDLANCNILNWLRMGNGPYTYMIITKLNDISKLRRETRQVPETIVNVTLETCLKVLTVDMMIRWMQGHSLSTMLNWTEEKFNWDIPSVPAYIRTYLKMGFSITNLDMCILVDAHIAPKISSFFLTSIDFSHLSIDIRSRLALSPAGFRWMVAMGHICPDDLIHPSDDRVVKFVSDCRDIISRGYYLEYHPLCRPPAFISSIGSLNERIQSFMREEVKSSTIDTMVMNKTIPVPPSTKPVKNYWKGLDFDFLRTFKNRPKGFDKVVDLALEESKSKLKENINSAPKTNLAIQQEPIKAEKPAIGEKPKEEKLKSAQSSVLGELKAAIEDLTYKTISEANLTKIYNHMISQQMTVEELIALLSTDPEILTVIIGQ